MSVLSGKSVLLLFLVLCFPSVARAREWLTSVSPKPDETMRDSCRYRLNILNPSRPVVGVLVVFERGKQFASLYKNQAVTAFATRRSMALLLAHHCSSKEREDMDVLPERGVGRALLTALDQFADSANHLELRTSKMVLFGFSGAGSLVARFADYAPGRVIAVVAIAPGQYEPLGMDTIELSDEALKVPQFIAVNGKDDVNGTLRPFRYFERYWQRGAPFTFVVQNEVPHCCALNLIALVLEWLNETVNQRKPLADRPLNAIDVRSGWVGFIRVRDSGVNDTWNEPVFNAADAWIGPSGKAKPDGTRDSGWLPSKRFADAWLKFQKKSRHPVTSLK